MPFWSRQLDTISPKKRSENMSKIRSSGTKPENLIRKFLWQNGVRYRCNVSTLPGRPDIAIKKYKLALDVHGCFWHGHKNCPNFRLPKSNTQFWTEKISKNIERDLRTKHALEKTGYQYFVIWECQVKNEGRSVIDHFTQVYFSKRNIDL